MDVESVLVELISQLNEQTMGTDIGLLLKASSGADFAKQFPNFRWNPSQLYIYGRFTMAGIDPWAQYERMQMLVRCLRPADRRNDKREPGWTSGWYLVSMLATDGGDLGGVRFTIYYLFSRGCIQEPDGKQNREQQDRELFLLVELPLVAQAI